MSLAGQRRQGNADTGFTVIELAVSMVVVGVLLGLTATGWARYEATQTHVSAAQELVSTMRNAQMRATAEAATYRVDVDAASRSLRVLRYDGAGYVLRSTTTLEGTSLQVVESSFLDKAGATTTSAYFYARGTASPGRVVLGRDGSTTQRTVTVEGLTGRVSTT